uniref:Uncharacterized protein n=1 Tax=Arundo donax TaxID=35708 RepID=A0A0A9C6M3_ARUDO
MKKLTTFPTGVSQMNGEHVADICVHSMYRYRREICSNLTGDWKMIKVLNRNKELNI